MIPFFLKCKMISVLDHGNGNYLTAVIPAIMK